MVFHSVILDLGSVGTNHPRSDGGFSSKPCSGWWFQSLWEIWKSVGMIKFPIYGKIKKCSKPPTRCCIPGVSWYWHNNVTHSVTEYHFQTQNKWRIVKDMSSPVIRRAIFQHETAMICSMASTPEISSGKPPTIATKILRNATIYPWKKKKTHETETKTKQEPSMPSPFDG